MSGNSIGVQWEEVPQKLCWRIVKPNFKPKFITYL